MALPSAASRRLLDEVRRIARFDSVQICIVGPSGTGKTLYAEEVHRMSPRHGGPFIKINLASIEGGLAGSELLGHVEGAYTGAKSKRMGGLLSANGGTLVLDEVTKAAPQVQHILLQMLDRDPLRHVGSDRRIDIDVRMIALTSISLEDAVRSGTLIPDLYERLKTFVLEIAPLAQRLADIPAILRAALRRHAPHFQYSVPPVVSDEVVRVLREQPLTGNHRELDGLIQRMLVNADGAPVLDVEHLPRRVLATAPRQRTQRLRYLEESKTQEYRPFATVRDEARHFHVSVPTIHRWRQEMRRDRTCEPESRVSRETITRRFDSPARRPRNGLTASDVGF